jgi:diacylglycerol kinase (ATP)
MGQISIYLNPKASQSSFNFEVQEIKKFFFRHDLTFYTPSSEEDLIEHVKLDKASGVDCIFSIGGDGTAHTIAQHLIGGTTKLLVLPGGTANDLASELGTNANLKKLAHVYNAKTTKLVDIIQVNGRFLMTNGGIGIAHDVAQQVNHFRKKSNIFKSFLKGAGKNAYSLLFVKHLLSARFKLHDVLVESPDFPRAQKRVQSCLILINNQPMLAGKFPVAPETKNNDGLFNVTIFTHTNRIEFIKTASEFLQGKYPENDQNLISFETNSLKLTSMNDKDLEFFGDGENFAPSKELEITIIPKGLEVFSHHDDLILCTGYSLDEIPPIQ